MRIRVRGNINPEAISEDKINEVYEGALNTILNKMKRATHVKTGELKKNWNIDIDLGARKARIYNETPYAEIEFTRDGSKHGSSHKKPVEELEQYVEEAKLAIKRELEKLLRQAVMGL